MHPTFDRAAMACDIAYSSPAAQAAEADRASITVGRVEKAAAFPATLESTASASVPAMDLLVGAVEVAVARRTAAEPVVPEGKLATRISNTEIPVKTASSG